MGHIGQVAMKAAYESARLSHDNMRQTTYPEDSALREFPSTKTLPWALVDTT